MTISFDNDNHAIVYAFEKIISYARENQYFFVANCTWWIASIYGLDNQLQQHIDNLALRQPAIIRSISTTPRDIARNVSVEFNKQSLEESSNSCVRDPLRRTRKGQVNPLPQSKRQLKKARQAKARQLMQQVTTNTKLANL